MEELKQKIIDLCNKSGLPLEAILFVTKDVWRDVEDTFRKVKEQATREQAEKMFQQQQEENKEEIEE